MKQFIMVSGNLQNGKDTFCDYLEEDLLKAGKKVTRIALADELRDMLATYFPKLLSHYNGVIQESINDIKVLNTSSPFVDITNSIGKMGELVTTSNHIYGTKNLVSRYLHQAVGEMIRHSVDNKFWANKVLDRLIYPGADWDVAIISDLRHSDDYYYMIDELSKAFPIQPTAIRVNRVGWTNDPTVLNDTSEKSMVDFMEYKFIVEAESKAQSQESAQFISNEILNGGIDEENHSNQVSL